MKSKSIGIIFLFFSSFSNSNAQLTISILNIEENRGEILIAIYNSKNDFLIESKVYKVLKIEISNKKASGSWADLPKGNYAISLFHDINKNKKLDTNRLGIPSEPYGFSNDAIGKFGPPSYEKAKFYYDGKELAIAIKLKKLF